MDFPFARTIIPRGFGQNLWLVFHFVSLLLDPRCECNCQLQSIVTAPSFLARGIKRKPRELECTGDMAEKKFRKVTFNKFLDSPLGYTRLDLVLFSIQKELKELKELK